MPHLPTNKSAALSLRRETSKDDAEQPHLRAEKGADLLMSLAETAKKQATEDEKERNPVTPSPTARTRHSNHTIASAPRTADATDGATEGSDETPQMPPSQSLLTNAINDSNLNPNNKKRFVSDSSLEAKEYKRARHDASLINRCNSQNSRQTEEADDNNSDDYNSNNNNNAPQQPVISPASSGEEQQQQQPQPQQQQQQQQSAKLTTRSGQHPVGHYYSPHHPPPHMMPGMYHHPAASYHHHHPHGPPPYGYAPYPPPPYYGMPSAGMFPLLAYSNNKNNRAPSDNQPKTPTASRSSPTGAGTPTPAKSGSNTATNAPDVDLSPGRETSMNNNNNDSSNNQGVTSHNRCIPLKRPLPSRCWSSQDAMIASQNIQLPDFSSLVNFPDYLSRGRSSSDRNGATAGKKPCVMCGQLRVCSASSLVRRGTSTSTANNSASSNDTSMHIIPRQNKGVCTVCDVAVWVVVGATIPAGQQQQRLEIKWCKGCKNFRPWAAFGEKGSATKCVRCRTRQKEKYAATKVGAVRKNNNNNTRRATTTSKA